MNLLYFTPPNNTSLKTLYRLSYSTQLPIHITQELQDRNNAITIIIQVEKVPTKRPLLPMKYVVIFKLAITVVFQL